MPGQVLILAGPQGCGKNLVQELIITPILGDRIAEPYRFAVGRTQFNQDLYKAAHLMIADQKKPTERADMREFIRRMASNDFDSLHPKNKEAIGLPTLWRMTISCNEEPADLKIIPPLDGLEDKLMLFRCALADMPMPTGDIQSRHEFAAAIRAELPAFIDSLLSFKIPSGLYHERFGIKGYLHPELVRMVRKLDSEEDLLELIKDARKLSPQLNLTLITAAELHQRLYKIKNLRQHLLAITRSPRWLGQLLSKLANRNDGIVKRGHYRTRRSAVHDSHLKWVERWNVFPIPTLYSISLGDKERVPPFHPVEKAEQGPKIKSGKGSPRLIHVFIVFEERSDKPLGEPSRQRWGAKHRS